MNKTFKYTYSVLRYRHDPLADEQVNVGMLLHSPDCRFADFRVRDTFGRFRAMYPDLDGEAFRQTLKAIERSFRKVSEGDGSHLLAPLQDAASLARKALPDDGSSFVWGDQGFGITTDPTAEFERLFERFVAHYDKEKRLTRADADIWRPVREMLASRNLSNRLQKKVIRSPVDAVEFEHAWKNGTWHVYEPLSFDLASEATIKDKARRWVGQLTTVVGTAETFTPHFVVGKPNANELLPAYEAAIGILKTSPIPPEIVEEEHISSLVDRMEDEIRHSDEQQRH